MSWFTLENADDVPSPALLVYPDRIQENLRRMLRLAGGPDRLRPHMKTHKMPEIIRLQVAAGIRKFKCATIAEAEMTAGNGAGDVLLAYQPVGPNTRRLFELAGRFPEVRFSCVIDNAASADQLASLSRSTGRRIEVLLDLDIGQHRTGLAPDNGAFELYRHLVDIGLPPGGLHAYDGHLHDPDVEVRTKAAEQGVMPVDLLRTRLLDAGLPVPRVVVGGTPTFPIHARRPDFECSPGTCVLWDAGYASKLPDMDFLQAAVLLTRVVSRPSVNRLCLDLGHKAVASEMPQPRVVFLNLENARPVMHSEEHLVVEIPDDSAFPVGTVVYGVPWHVCPTVALHDNVVVVENHRAGGRWPVAGRQRALTI